MKSYVSLIVLLIGALSFIRPAHADTIHCTAISSLPATLSSAGVYCLTQDLTYAPISGSAVNITADSVMLDLNGHALRGTGASNVESVGVNVAGQKYFTITNGTIAGFSRGVAAVSDGKTRAKGGLIDHLKVQRSFLYGLLVDCDGCVIRDNMVTDTNVTASFPDEQAVGIALDGTGQLVTGNRVYNTFTLSNMPAFAISASSSYSTVANNYVGNGSMGTNPTYGFIVSGQSVLLSNNQAELFSFCYWLQGVDLKYRDNLSGGCTDAFGGGASGGTHDLGGNN